MLALENHGGLTGRAEGVLRLLQGARSEWVGALCDLGNYREDPYREFELTAPHTIMTHAKPITHVGDRVERVDYVRAGRILHEAGYRGFLSIEHETAGEDPMEEVPRFAAYLRGATRWWA